MSDERITTLLQHAAPVAPPPEARERILRRCRREMATRRAAARRRAQRLSWGLAAGIAAVLLLNAVEERGSRARIAALVAGRSSIAQAAPAPGTLRAVRARATLLAAALRDPDKL